MPFKKGDPRAREAGIKGAAIRRARREARREMDEAEKKPAEPLHVQTIKQNKIILLDIYESFSDEAALGVLAQIATNPKEPAETRLRAAQAWLRHSG